MINKHIIGLKITTTNENNQAQEDINQLRKSFYDQANAELQTFKKEPYTYVVYTNYQGDFQQGNYDCYLGVKDFIRILWYQAWEVSDFWFSLL